MSKQLPLIVVLGATACGKSRLAIEIARKFHGEIISADSMQVYRDLDIVTNKVTEEEQQQVKHHMISFLDPRTRFSVVDFRNKSLSIINDLVKEGLLPIVVGGTHYYIESLIWKGFLLGALEEPISSDDVYDAKNKDGTIIDSEAKLLNKIPQESLHCDQDFLDMEKFFDKPIYNDGFAHVESEKLWTILEKVDSEAAHLYHPRDKRRIIRSLQIIQRNKRNYSELLKDVNKSSQGDTSSLGGPLRFQPTCVFWLNCEDSLLEKIMDERVDEMLNRGLLAELETFHENYNKPRLIDSRKPDYEKGIFQSIGFKEFHDYLALDKEDKETEEGNKLLRKSIDEMKISTKRFARRQLKWIRTRFLRPGTRDLPPVFKLTTTTDEDEWINQVRKPAFEIIKSVIENRPLTDELMLLKQEPNQQTNPNLPGKLYCEICDRTFIGSYYIEDHLKSKNHERKARGIKRKKQELEDE